MNIFNDFISAIESILDFVVELLDDVVTLITSIPSILAEAIEFQYTRPCGRDSMSKVAGSVM